MPVATVVLSGTLSFKTAGRGASRPGRNCTLLISRVMVAWLSSVAIVEVVAAMAQIRGTDLTRQNRKARLILIASSKISQ